MHTDTSATSAVLKDGIAWLIEQVSVDGKALDVLDVGGGTGGLALELAAAGHQVTVVDPSLAALATAAQRAQDVDLPGSFTTLQGDAETLGDVIADHSMDLALCHGVLDVVDEPLDALTSIHRALRPGGALSLLVAQRHAAVMRHVVRGDVRKALAVANSEHGTWGEADPLRRRFETDDLCSVVLQAGFSITDIEGVDVFRDLSPASADTPRGALIELEALASNHPAFAEIAEFVHVHAGPRSGTEVPGVANPQE